MKRIISFLFTFLFVYSVNAQGLSDLSFGTNSTLEVITWNLKLFPTNGATTASTVKQVIEALDADILALQEIDDEALFEQIVNELDGFEVLVGSSGGAWKLAYVYRPADITVNSVYEIYTSTQYASPFPRRPFVIDFNFKGSNYIVINNHYKAMGDGILDLSNTNDEEYRRFLATNLIKEYIDTNFPERKVFVVGDLNDEVTDAYENNVFRNILDDSDNYLFADYNIATGPSANWSYPSWPSHIDHIIITNELFENYNSSSSVVQTIKIENYLSGGLTEYYNNISDHRPVALKFEPNSRTVFSKNFDDQSLTSGGWTSHNIDGAQTWTVPSNLYGLNNSYCGYINGYSNGNNENEDWFISPAFSPSGFDNIKLSFWNTSGYSGPRLQVFYSTNFDGNPAEATWTEITNATWHNGVTNWEWTYSGEIDLSSLTGSSANIGFKYTSTSSQAATWEIDDISLRGQIKSFTVSVSASPSNAGTVSGGGEFEFNQEAVLTATPNSSYEFVNWTESGQEVSTSSTFTFPVTQNRTLVANFQVKSYTITATVNPENSGSVTGTGTYNQGQTVSLTATSAEGYTFVKWTENGTQVSTSPTYTFTAIANRNLVANFILKTYTINASVNPSNSGTVTGAGTYNHGATVTLTANANTGYTFEKWTENQQDVSTSQTYEFQATSNRSLVAQFKLNTYNVRVTIEPEDAGNVTGGGTYNHNQTAELLATANDGWEFEKWTINGSDVTANPTSFVVTQNANVIAKFLENEPVYFTLTIEKSGNGSTTPEAGSYTHQEGTSVDLIAVSDEGWKFEKWVIGSNEVTESSTRISINANITATAYFTLSSSADNSTLLGLTVYPNPTSGMINIISSNEPTTIKVFDLLGKCLFEQAMDTGSADLKFLPNGVYVLKIFIRDNVITTRLVKQ